MSTPVDLYTGAGSSGTPERRVSFLTLHCLGPVRSLRADLAPVTSGFATRSPQVGPGRPADATRAVCQLGTVSSVRTGQTHSAPPGGRSCGVPHAHGHSVVLNRFQLGLVNGPYLGRGEYSTVPRTCKAHLPQGGPMSWLTI